MSESIRPYRAEDVEAVREVHLRAFDGRGEEARLVELLHAAGAAPVSLVATVEPDGRVVGRVLFSPVQIDRRRSSPPTMVGPARRRWWGRPPSGWCPSTRAGASARA